MKFLIFISCAILGLSVSIPIENASTEKNQFVQFNKGFPEYKPIINIKKNQNRSREVIKYKDIEPAEENKKQYFFIRDIYGNVVIIDAISYEKIISYYLPDLDDGISAVVGDTLYHIVPQNGTILSTSIANIVEGRSNINWAHVGSLPSGHTFSYNGVAVDGPLIYFVTSIVGDLYVYDTVSRLVTKLNSFGIMNGYASLLVVQKTLYIFYYNYFSSFDGSTLNTLTTPERRYASGLFQMGNNICLVGGNYTDVYPDPVHCYNPVTKEWHISSYINEARRYPGVVTTESKTYIFGGAAYYFYPNFKSRRLYSVEVLDHETNIWSFAPTPFNDEIMSDVQVFLFNY